MRIVPAAWARPRIGGGVFDGAELGDDVVPDGITILRFRHQLEKHGLTKQIFDEIQVAEVGDESWTRASSRRRLDQECDPDPRP